MRKIVRNIIIAAAVLSAAFVLLVAVQVYRAFRNMPAQPPALGKTEFKHASNQIRSMRGTVAFGNSPQAKDLASEFAKLMKEARRELFSGGNPNDVSPSKGEFLTYCQLREDQIAFLVHVPELRRYTSEAKDNQAKIAWAVAQALVRKKGIPPPTELAVGLRGVLLYGPVHVGRVLDEAPSAKETGIAQTLSGLSAEQELYRFFGPPPVNP